MAAVPPARRRALFPTAVVAALAVLVAGLVIAARGYLDTSGPDGAVRGYFAALERADAPAALGFGTLPAGPRTLLTSTVLRAQRSAAPIGDLHLVATDRSGDTARVSVDYTLGFPGGARQVHDSVEVVHRGRSWRLARTAVATRLDLLQAVDRATLAGAGVPSGTVLMFPGAVPISFDTAYLQLDPANSTVALAGPSSVGLSVQVSAAGRAAVLAAVRTALATCLSGSPDANPRCPVPSDRYVPGSLRGTVPAASVARVALAVSDDPAGLIDVTAAGLPMSGRWTVLDFDNRPVARSGTLQLPIATSVVARTPIAVTWTADQ